MNIHILFLILLIVLLIALFIGIVSIHAVKNPRVKKLNTISFVMAVIATVLLMINFVNLGIGSKQKPIVFDEKTIQISIDAYYKDGQLYVLANSQNNIQDDTTTPQPIVTLKELLIQKEWNFIFPFYLKEIEYEYVNTTISKGEKE